MRRFRTTTPHAGHMFEVRNVNVAAHLLPYVPAWAMSATLLPAGAIAHHLWGTDPTVAPWAAVGLTVAGTALTALTWAAGKARGLFTRAHATASVGAGSAYILAAAIAGATAQPLLGMYLMAAPVFGLSWNIRRLLRSQGEGNDGWSEAAEKVGLLGTRLSRPQIEGTRVTADVQLARGEQTVEDLQGAARRIASLLGVRRGGVRTTPNPDRADRAQLIVTPVDTLKKIVPWPGPSNPGGSTSAGASLGQYEDGRPVQLWLTGDHRKQRNATHMLIMGMNGSGKSEAALLLATELLTRTDEVLWVADPVKGKQTFGPAEEGIDWFATSKSEAKAMVRALSAIIPARASWLGERGFKQWESDCGLPHLTVILEEASGYLSDSRALVNLLRQARSVGISIIVSVQRATHTSLPTDARAELGASMCFGVKGSEDADFALSDYTLDSGADPGLWANSHPGYAYLEAPGVDKSRWSIPLRTFYITADQMRSTISTHAHMRARLDDLSARAAGTSYTGAANLSKPATVTAVTLTPEQPMQAVDDDDFEDAVDSIHQSDGDEDLTELPDDHEPDLLPDLDTAKDIPADDDATLILVSPSDDSRPPTEVARNMLREALVAHASAGHDTIRPADLVDVRRRIGRTPGWLTGELRRLVDEGIIGEHPSHGVYALRIPACA